MRGVRCILQRRHFPAGLCTRLILLDVSQIVALEVLRSIRRGGTIAGGLAGERTGFGARLTHAWSPRYAGPAMMAPRAEKGELLIVGPSWLGDAVMMGALVRRLKAERPARHITVLTPAHLEDLAARLPGVDATLVNPFGHGALRLAERLRFGRSLGGRFDAAIVLPHSWKSALIPLFAGAPRRTGFVGEARWGVLNDARRLDAAALPRMVDRFCLLA